MRRTGKVIREASDLMWLMLTHLSQGQSLANMSVLLVPMEFCLDRNQTIRRNPHG
jgi:hypothetical protein